MRGAVLVTGAASGIGRACAGLLSARGWRVALTDMQEEKKGNEIAAEIRNAHPDSQATYYQLDVRSEQQTDATVSRIVKDFGGLSGAVANAGVLVNRPFMDTTVEDFMRVLNVNLLGTFITGRAVSRLLVAQGSGGSIVNMSSVNSSLVIPGMAGYVASKGGVQQLTRLMAVELAPHGIRCNAVGPGSVATEMAFAAYQDQEPIAGLGLTKEQIMKARTPLGRMAEPVEIASIVAFLLSEDASYLTGETIMADGGRAHLNGAIPIPYGKL